jgi:uncharacterized membrane protein YecN with MAPEG domain
LSAAAYTGFSDSCKHGAGVQAGAETRRCKAMVTLPITLTIAAAAALINVWLAVRVSHLRRLHKVLLGDEGNPRVTARMRAHSNFVENAPFVLILLGLIEAAGGSQTLLWAAGILFILSRLAHAFGMDRPGPNALRIGGTAVAWLCLIGLAAYAITVSYGGLGGPPALDRSVA